MWKRSACKPFAEKWEENDFQEDTDTVEKIILKLILKEKDGKMLTGFIWLKIWGQVVSSSEHDNEPLGSKESGNFSRSWTTISFSRRIMLYGISCFLFYEFVRSIYIDYTCHKEAKVLRKSYSQQVSIYTHYRYC